MPSATAATCGQFLQQLLQLVEKVELYEGHQAITPTLLEARIHPEMFPLKIQARVACSFALRSCFPLCNLPVPELSEAFHNYTDLKALIKNTQQKLHNLPASPAPEKLSDKAGFNDVELETNVFLQTFALPNFYFHLSMVYAIAKQSGVPVTKGDFDGLHDYPEDFSWERASQD